MTANNVDLQSVSGDGNFYGDYEVGRNAKSICLKTDGHGPTGYYDRVHVITSSGEKLILIAHNCVGYRLMDLPA